MVAWMWQRAWRGRSDWQISLRVPVWGTVDVLKCGDPGYQENSHAGFCYCSQLLPGPVPAGLGSS